MAVRSLGDIDHLKDESDSRIHGWSKELPDLRSWLPQALLGLRWKVPDGTDDGIRQEIVFRCPVFVIFELKARVDSPLQSVQS